MAELSSPSRNLLGALLVGAACYVGATVGSLVRFPQVGAAIFFPPYAILTAALLLSPPRRWWMYMLAAAAGDFWPHVSGGAPVSFALMAEIANFARALVAVAGMRRFGDPQGRLDTLRSMAVFLLSAGVLAPLVGAFLGAGVVALHQGADRYWAAWRPWLLSNTMTALTILPMLLLGLRSRFLNDEPDRRVGPAPTPWRRVEAAALLVGLVVVGVLVFRSPSTEGDGLPALAYAPLPLLMWAGVRFGPLGTSASVMLVASLAIWGTLDGLGPFVTQRPATGLGHLQLFLFTRSVPLLLLSALILQQRRTADALRASQERHRAVVEDQTEPICRFVPDGTLTFANGACGRALGRTPEQLVGSNFWTLMPSEAQAAHGESLTHLRPEQPVAAWEQERVTTTGEPRWEQWRVRALFDQSGRLVDFQALGLDLTERRRAEQERQLLQAQQAAAEVLREADRRKDEFLAMVAHELRNPLAPIGMVAEVLRGLPDPDESVKWASEVIARQVKHLTRLVDDLLDISRITSGSIQLHVGPVQLAQVIASSVETSRPLLEARGLTLTPLLPALPLTVRGDAVRLGQVVSNLLNNAIKYSEPDGDVGVRATREDQEVVVRVRDGGAGIPSHMLERVFEPFTQVDGPRDGALGGLGLGLHLVRRLVELHGGTVQAHSAGPGRGSEFELRMPALDVEVVAGAAAADTGPEIPTVAKATAVGAAAPRILVVDDVVDAANTLARFLRMQGCSVDVVHDGQAGLDTALRLGPDIVFLDLSLPKMGGLEVARRLRRRFEPTRMLLVATTGYGQAADRARTAEAGFDHHLTKPTDPALVQSLLSGWTPDRGD